LSWDNLLSHDFLLKSKIQKQRGFVGDEWSVSDMLFVWIGLYGLVHVIADYGMSFGGTWLWLRGILLTIYVLLFLHWILQTDRQQQAGLNPMFFQSRREWLRLLPLGIYPVYNLIAGDGFAPAGHFLLEMACICLTEELLFRGFLLSYLRRRGALFGMLLTSLIFSGLHFVNAFSGGDLPYVWLQVLSSFFVSVCYCGVSIHLGSVLPCAAAHFLTNITGAGSISGGYALLGLWGCIAIYALWSLKLCLDIRKIHKEIVT